MMNDKMKKFVKSWQIVVAACIALSSVAGVGWTANQIYSHTHGRIDDNQSSIDIVSNSVQGLLKDKDWQRFFSLDKLRREFGLDEHQYKVWCELAQRLAVRKTCPQFLGRMPRKD